MQEKFTLGQRVRCRDKEGEWQDGVVKQINPLKVARHGLITAFQWDEVCAEDISQSDVNIEMKEDEI